MTSIHDQQKPLLQVTGLCCDRDDRRFIDGLSFSVERGDIWHIQGPNGSGKTTLLRALCGLSSASEGHIYWQGTVVTKVRAEYGRQCVFVGHSLGLKAALTPLENLHWYAALRGQINIELLQRALNKVGLLDCVDVPCGHLSAGQQRRVSLARLFVDDARLWVLDEPFTAIDAMGITALEGWLAQHAKLGGGVIVTTHHTLGIGQAVKRLILGQNSV